MQIRLLGEFSVTVEGEPIPALNHTRLQSLLAYLIAHHECAQLRAQIAYTFWPEAGDQQALTNLRNTLYRLRQALPEADQALIADREQLGWRQRDAATVDLIAFDDEWQAAQRARTGGRAEEERRALVRMSAVYGGDFMPSLYDDWVLALREGYRARYLLALQRLVDLDERAGAFSSAIEHAQRILTTDPLHEATCRRLMLLQRRAGNRAAALRLYHQCADGLRHELGVDPDTATRQVYQTLLLDDVAGDRGPESSPAEPTAATPPFIGRTEELTAINAELRRITSARNARTVLLLQGEAGIGKTRLAETCLAWAAGQGFTILSARCFRSSRIALGAVAAWLRQASLDGLAPYQRTELARLTPEVAVGLPQRPLPAMKSGGPAAVWQQQRFFAALADSIRRQHQPLLLFLDDIQWIDAESLTILNLLLHHPQPCRLAFMATQRLGEEAPAAHALADFAADIQRHVSVTHLSLERLGPSETLRLAEGVSQRTLTPSEANDIYRYTEGNPLFVVETVRAGILGDDLHRALENGSAVRLLPPKMAAVLASRLSSLTPASLRIARRAAVLGRSFNYRTLQAICDATETGMLGALDELWQKRIVVARPGRDDLYDFTHDQLRHAAYQGMSPMLRQAAHRRAADFLSRLHAASPGRVADQVALHYERAGDEAAAIPFLIQAAAYAEQRFAHEAVIRHCAHAIRLCRRKNADEPTPCDNARLRNAYASMARAYGFTAHQAEAQQAYADALAWTTSAFDRADLLRRAGDAELAVLHFAAAETHYAHALRALASLPADRTTEWRRLWLDVRQSQVALYYYRSQLDELAALLTEIEAPMAQYGTPRQKSDYFGALSQLTMRRTRYAGDDRLLSYVSAALDQAKASGDEFKIALHRFGYGFALLILGRTEAALERLRAAYTAETQLGDGPVLNQVLVYLVAALRRLGRVEEARPYIDESLTLAYRQSNARYTGAAEGHAAWLAFRDGDEVAAMRHAANAHTQWADTPYPFQWFGLMPQLALAVKGPRVQPALDAAERMLAPSQQILPAPLTDALQAAVDAGVDRPDEARRRFEAAVAQAQALRYL